MVMKCLVIQYLYDLSDSALEDTLIDRLSFQRFIGLNFENEIPDYSTVWSLRERLIKVGLLDIILKRLKSSLTRGK